MFKLHSLVKDVIKLSTTTYKDHRGEFLELYSEREVKSLLGLDRYDFVQDNLIHSVKNSFRGLHYQDSRSPMGKLVQLIKGRAIDVAVNTKLDSINFGDCIVTSLDSVGDSVWIPPHYAHGIYFLDDSIVNYKATGYFINEHSHSLSIREFCTQVQLDFSCLILSDKDKNAPPLSLCRGYDAS